MNVHPFDKAWQNKKQLFLLQIKIASVKCHLQMNLFVVLFPPPFMVHLFWFSKGLDQGFLIGQQFCYELWVSPAEKSVLMRTHAKCTICRREVHKSALTHFMILQWDSTKHSLLTGNAPHSPRVCEGVVWDSVSKDRISMFSQHSISQAALIYFCAFYDYKSLQKSVYTRKIGAFFFPADSSYFKKSNTAASYTRLRKTQRWKIRCKQLTAFYPEC